MDARLGRHQAVRVVAVECEGRALDTGLLAGLKVEYLTLEAAPFRPLRVHAKQHLSPVLRFSTASTRVNGDDRVRAIVFTAEHLLHLGGFDLLLQVVEPALQIGTDVLPSLGPFHEHGEIVHAAAQRITQRDVVFDSAAALHHLLRVGLIVPEGRAGGGLLDLG
jgi:hypothetical protein